MIDPVGAAVADRHDGGRPGRAARRDERARRRRARWHRLPGDGGDRVGAAATASSSERSSPRFRPSAAEHHAGGVRRRVTPRGGRRRRDAVAHDATAIGDRRRAGRTHPRCGGAPVRDRWRHRECSASSSRRSRVAAPPGRSDQSGAAALTVVVVGPCAGSAARAHACPHRTHGSVAVGTWLARSTSSIRLLTEGARSPGTGTRARVRSRSSGSVKAWPSTVSATGTRAVVIEKHSATSRARTSAQRATGAAREVLDGPREPHQRPRRDRDAVAGRSSSALPACAATNAVDEWAPGRSASTHAARSPEPPAAGEAEGTRT